MLHLDQYSTYVLVGRDQYQVLLDSKKKPTEMWSNVGFAIGSQVTIDGGERPYKIISSKRLGMGLISYKLWRYST